MLCNHTADVVVIIRARLWDVVSFGAGRGRNGLGLLPLSDPAVHRSPSLRAVLIYSDAVATKLLFKGVQSGESFGRRTVALVKRSSQGHLWLGERA